MEVWKDRMDERRKSKRNKEERREERKNYDDDGNYKDVYTLKTKDRK